MEKIHIDDLIKLMEVGRGLDRADFDSEITNSKSYWIIKRLLGYFHIQHPKIKDLFIWNDQAQVLFNYSTDGTIDNIRIESIPISLDSVSYWEGGIFQILLEASHQYGVNLRKITDNFYCFEKKAHSIVDIMYGIAQVSETYHNANQILKEINKTISDKINKFNNS